MPYTLTLIRLGFIWLGFIWLELTILSGPTVHCDENFVKFLKISHGG